MVFLQQRQPPGSSNNIGETKSGETKTGAKELKYDINGLPMALLVWFESKTKFYFLNQPNNFFPALTAESATAPTFFVTALAAPPIFFFTLSTRPDIPPLLP